MPTSAQSGDVVLVRFPFTDLTTAKLRPAVVLATHGDDLTIVGIFSGPQQPLRATWISLSSQDPAFSQTGLKTTSVIKAERIAVIEQSLVVRRLGSLPPAQMERVKQAVKLTLNLD
jgi:mRNA interferase MazF